MTDTDKAGALTRWAATLTEPDRGSDIHGRVGRLKRVRPRCEVCGGPRELLISVDLTAVPQLPLEALTFAACTSCIFFEDSGSRTTLWTGPPAELPEVERGAPLRAWPFRSIPDLESLHALVDLPDAGEDFDGYMGALSDWGEALANEGRNDAGVQIGGHPSWLQGEGTPICGDHGRMDLLLQLPSEEAAVDFGDAGVLYAFRCAECPETRVVVQSH